MLDNSNFVGEKGIKGKKSLAYGLFCYVEISTKIWVPNLLVRVNNDPECFHSPMLVLKEVN